MTILILAFLGFVLGRVGHIYGGQIKSLHHWIYGLILMIAGLILHKSFCGLWIFAFGLGLFVSDLKDFMEMKFYGVDDVKKKKFWHID